MDPLKIGEFIKRKRKEFNLSQSDLASRLNITAQAVSKWENGRGIPDIEMLKELSTIFKVNINELLNGQAEKKNTSHHKIIYIGIILIIICFVFIIILLNKEETFKFSSLASDNAAFSLKGVMAYNKNKKSIYISEVNYAKKDEEEYKDVECLLYESSNDTDKIISRCNKIGEENKTYYLTELLQGIEFNVDDYECSCEKNICNNLFIRINALNKDDKVITYQIPIQIKPTCEK